MPKPQHPQVITANDLFEGDVIYLTQDGRWTREHGDAAVAHTPEEAERLLTVASAQAEKIVGPYRADVAIDDDGRPRPLHFREAFRTRGPSNYFHGKQAEL